MPPVRRHIQGQSRSARLRPEPVTIDTTPMAMPLSALGGIEIHSVRRTADQPLFDGLMEQHHYLGYQQPVGEHLKYLVWARGAFCTRPVAALAWSPSPRHLGARDRYIGWSQEARRRNIHLIAYNTRVGTGVSTARGSVRHPVQLRVLEGCASAASLLCRRASSLRSFSIPSSSRRRRLFTRWSIFRQNLRK